MTIYLDSSVLIAYLYEELDQRERFLHAQRLFQRIQAGEVQAAISFYALPELYSYVVEHYPDDEVNETFRTSMVELFSVPLIVIPFLDRTELNLWRRKFEIRDPTDALHVAAALARGCEGIVAYDEHFQDVADLIPYYTPEAFLATLEQEENV